jgi:hypothetical protein
MFSRDYLCLSRLFSCSCSNERLGAGPLFVVAACTRSTRQLVPCGDVNGAHGSGGGHATLTSCMVTTACAAAASSAMTMVRRLCDNDMALSWHKGTGGTVGCRHDMARLRGRVVPCLGRDAGTAALTGTARQRCRAPACSASPY